VNRALAEPIDRPEYECGILGDAEAWRDGRQKTYDLDEVGEMLGLDDWGLGRGGASICDMATIGERGRPPRRHGAGGTASYHKRHVALERPEFRHPHPAVRGACQLLRVSLADLICRAVRPGVVRRAHDVALQRLGALGHPL